MTRPASSNAFVAILAVVMALGCAWTARRSAVPGEAQLASASVQRGERIFRQNCRGCHVGSAGHLGLSPDGQPLPAALLALKVRQGVGRMPAFPVGRLDDAALTDVVGYLVDLRHRSRPDWTSRIP